MIRTVNCFMPDCWYCCSPHLCTLWQHLCSLLLPVSAALSSSLALTGSTSVHSSYQCWLLSSHPYTLWQHLCSLLLPMLAVFSSFLDHSEISMKYHSYLRATLRVSVGCIPSPILLLCCHPPCFCYILYNYLSCATRGEPLCSQMLPGLQSKGQRSICACINLNTDVGRQFRFAHQYNHDTRTDMAYSYIG